MRRSRVVGIAAVAAIATGTLLAATYRGAGSDSGRDARAIHREALDAVLRDDLDSAFALFASAWVSDPEWVIPLAEIIRTAEHIGVPARVVRRLDSAALALAPGDSSLMRCVHSIATMSYDGPLARRLREHASPLTRRCGTLLWDLIDKLPEPHLLAASYGGSVFFRRDERDWLLQADPAAAIKHARRTPVHPIEEVLSTYPLAFSLHRLGEHAAAAAAEQAGMTRARQLGLGATYIAADRLRGHLHPDDARADSTTAAHAREVEALIAETMAELFPSLSARTRVIRLLNRGLDHQSVGKLRESNEYFTRALRLADSMQLSSARAYAAHRRGRNMVKLGRLDDAERDLLLAREVGRSAENPMVLSEASHDLLHLYEARGEYASAVQAGMDFGRFSRLTSAIATVPMAQHDLGWLYRRHGNVAGAEAAFQRMLATLDRTGDFWAGEYYEYAGQLELARERYERAVRHSGQDRGRAYAGLVRIHEAMGDVAAAARVANIADNDSAAWHPEYAPLVPGVLARNGDRRAARVQFRQAREAMVRRGQMQSFAHVALEAAENERWLGDHGGAIILADSAAEIAGRLGARELEMRARALAALTRVTLAPAAASATVHLTELVSAARRGDAMRIPQLSSALHLLHAEALAALDRPTGALAALSVAAAWVDSMAARIAADPSRAGFRSQHRAVTNRALALLVANRRVADRERRFAAWSARRKGGSAGLAWDSDVMRRLGPSQAIIDYVVLDSAVSAMVLTRSGAAIQALPVSPDSLRRWIARFRAPIAPRVGSAVDRAHLGFDEATAEQLYRGLVDPLVPLLAGRTTLTILPDGVLHMLPFDALVTSRVPSRFLIDDYTVSYATFVGAKDLPTPHVQRWTALAVGPPGDRTVAGASDELTAVAEALGDRLTVIEGPHATADAVRERVERGHPSVLHVATHAEANDASPDHARLALAKDSASAGGWLHAYQVREWQLGSALVVLSACETGAGRLAGGEGTLSLSRAFLQAGARGTIATLWPIGAPTASLMRPFYQALDSGASTAEALRLARLELRRRGYDHPFYWAPFVLTTNLSHFAARED